MFSSSCEHVIRLAAAVVLFGTCAPCPLFAQGRAEELLDRAVDLVGCYEIRFSAWSHEEWAEAANRLPNRIWLTGEQLLSERPQVYAAFVMRPAPGARQGPYPEERWSISTVSDSLALRWSNSFFEGIQAIVSLEGSVGDWQFEGRTSTWTDVIRIVDPERPSPEPPHGVVTGRMIDCS